METNVLGQLLVTRALLPYLERDCESGRPPVVINMSSAGGSITTFRINDAIDAYRPTQGTYSMSKAALNMLVRLNFDERVDV